MDVPRPDGTSKNCDRGETIRLASVFARRPKLELADDMIVMKVNAELGQYAFRSSKFGIPVFAGVPLMNSIVDGTLDVPCAIFHLPAHSELTSDIYVKMDLRGIVTENDSPRDVVRPLCEADLRVLTREAETTTWGKGVESLRQIRSNLARGPFAYTRYGGYKPFHLMLVD